jgi:hypothetical protein
MIISRSHAHLRAAFRAFHPSILKYADMILSAYLVSPFSIPLLLLLTDVTDSARQQPSSPEDGIYLHAASGSAGQLQEAHILVLQELLTFDDRDTGLSSPSPLSLISVSVLCS